MEKTFHWFRKIAVAEGISFITLLFVAMPLKYVAHLPLAVTICGGLHGVLFITFMVLAGEVKSGYKKDMRWMGKAALASVVPFGTFVMDKQWKKEQAVSV